MRLYLIAAVALIIITPLALMNAHAKDAQDTKEQKLEAIFTKMMTSQKTEIEKRGAKLQLTGALEIEKASNYYAVTMPEMKIIDTNGESTNIGMVAVNATPTNDDNIWKMAIAIPTPITKQNAEGKNTGRIDIGNQKFNGVYDSQINNFTKIIMEYKNLKFTDLEDNFVMNMQEMKLVSDLDIKDDLLSGPTDMRISNIDFSDTDTAKKTTIEAITIYGNYEDIDILSFAQNPQKIDFTKLGGIELKGEIKNLVSDVKVSKIGFGFTGKKPEDGFSDQKLSIKYDGLESLDNNKNSLRFAPADMNIDLELNKLPLADLLKLGQMKIASGENQPPAAAMNMLQALTSLPTKMANAGSNLDIENFDFKNSLYEIKTRGNLKASSTSPMMVVGDIVLKAMNMDKLKTTINDSLSSSSKNEQKAMQNILKQINFIETNCDGGKGNYDCTLNFSEAGKISLNGKPLNLIDIMQMGR